MTELQQMNISYYAQQVHNIQHGRHNCTQGHDLSNHWRCWPQRPAVTTQPLRLFNTCIYSNVLQPPHAAQ